MHTLLRGFVDLLISLNPFTTWLAAKIAALAGHAHSESDVTLAAIVLTTLIFAVFCGFWVIVARARFLRYRAWARRQFATAGGDICLRDAIIEACGESVVVLDDGRDFSRSFQSGAADLQDCLAGPDAASLANALDALLTGATTFELTARTGASTRIAVRGCMVDGQAMTFLRKDPVPELPDYLAALQALPVPVWIRDRNLNLRWANDAFLAATGSHTLEAAMEKNVSLDEAETEFFHTARDGRQIIDIRRPVTLFGERRVLAFTVRGLENGDLVATAVEVNGSAPHNGLKSEQRAILGQFINGLGSAIAVFDANRRLVVHNAAYARLWGLSERWLNTGPLADDILDQLREAGRLPERRNYAQWKSEHLRIFAAQDAHLEELWHLPAGNSLRLVAKAVPGGGIIFLLDDITDRLRLESAYNLLAKVQAATLNAFNEAIAIFGTDGCLKFHNDRFSELWSFAESDLQDQPHISQLVRSCESRFGSCEVWDAVLAAINAVDTRQCADWMAARREDGMRIALSLSRLPDGATMAHYAQISEPPVRDWCAAAA